MASTIHDVARVAGVGIGTVSRVINNHPGVRPATREKVLKAVAQLSYEPNPIARSMISKRTGAIGVIVSFFTRPFNTEVLRGMETVLARLGKELVLYNVETDTQRDHYFSELASHRRVDGLLILSLIPEDSIALRFKEAKMPVVLVDAYSPFHTSLVVDNIEGAYQAIMCLIQKGHRRIGFINGVIEGNFKFNQANDRLIGVHRAFGEADIFAASDMQAVGVLEAAKDLNINVPEDLSVIGFDGIEIAELLGLSTIQQPMRQMGELGVSKLIEQVENPQRLPELIRFNTTLVERRTTSVLTSGYQAVYNEF